MNAIAPIFDLDRRQYIETVTGYLLDDLKDKPSKAKAAADLSRAPLPTAKHWTDRTSAPEGVYMSRLRASLPSFDAKMAELEGKRRDGHADFIEKLNAFFMAEVVKDPNSPASKLIYETFFKHHNTEAGGDA